MSCDVYKTNSSKDLVPPAPVLQPANLSVNPIIGLLWYPFSIAYWVLSFTWYTVFNSTSYIFTSLLLIALLVVLVFAYGAIVWIMKKIRVAALFILNAINFSYSVMSVAYTLVTSFQSTFSPLIKSWASVGEEEGKTNSNYYFVKKAISHVIEVAEKDSTEIIDIKKTTGWIDGTG